MHTINIDCSSLETIEEIRIHHNSDWSGDIIVEWKLTTEDDVWQVEAPVEVAFATAAFVFTNQPLGES